MNAIPLILLALLGGCGSAEPVATDAGWENHSDCGGWGEPCETGLSLATLCQTPILYGNGQAFEPQTDDLALVPLAEGTHARGGCDFEVRDGVPYSR